MDKTIRWFSSVQEMKDEQYRYWLSLTPTERVEGAWRLSAQLYGIDPDNPPPMDKRGRFVKVPWSSKERMTE